MGTDTEPIRTPLAARVTDLYLGDIVPVLRAVVRAEFEAASLQRYNTDPELADAIAELAAGAAHLVDVGKWVQARLWGFEWYQRPTTPTQPKETRD
jgi:hypothetical protein